ncbi:hypothetical protein QAD02_009661 [Eretmocerus hayati]|uniref:Uncharacterized protein n=1 Tax=Eretmocerus hayati TaxID=131215 RepID=A0ACC2NB81_9HYME|nr:hypothetical protein QAD02_009661 [Eretmocerus hayati]
MQMIVLLIFWGFCINALSANTTPIPAEESISLPRFEELKNYLSGCKQVQPSNTGISRFLSDGRHTIQEPVEIPAETPSLCEPGPSRASDSTGYQEPIFAGTTDDKCDQEQSRNLEFQQELMCDLCSENFDRKDHRDSHLTGRHAGSPVSCHICGDRFKNRRNLKDHMLRKHSGERAHLCDHCGKCFAIKGDFDTHMRLHSNNPLSCEFCHKNFARKYELRLHVRAHTGEQPYSCELCGKRFSGNKGLKKHMFTHTNEKLHECDICNKCFKHRSSLTFHVRTQHVGSSISIGSTVNAGVETPEESNVTQDSRVLTGITGKSQ